MFVFDRTGSGSTGSIGRGRRGRAAPRPRTSPGGAVGWGRTGVPVAGPATRSMRGPDGVATGAVPRCPRSSSRRRWIAGSRQCGRRLWRTAPALLLDVAHDPDRIVPDDKVDLIQGW